MFIITVITRKCPIVKLVDDGEKAGRAWDPVGKHLHQTPGRVGVKICFVQINDKLQTD